MYLYRVQGPQLIFSLHPWSASYGAALHLDQPSIKSLILEGEWITSSRTCTLRASTSHEKITHPVSPKHHLDISFPGTGLHPHCDISPSKFAGTLNTFIARCVVMPSRAVDACLPSCIMEASSSFFTGEGGCNVSILITAH